jgi:hypothetical protein
MFKTITSRIAVVSIIGLAALPAFAKDAAEVQAEADNKENQAAATRSVATGESTRSAEAQLSGDASCAAKHAREAAEQTKDANKLSEKAADLQTKADKKAIKESK